MNLIKDLIAVAFFGPLGVFGGILGVSVVGNAFGQWHRERVRQGKRGIPDVIFVPLILLTIMGGWLVPWFIAYLLLRWQI